MWREKQFELRSTGQPGRLSPQSLFTYSVNLSEWDQPHLRFAALHVHNRHGVRGRETCIPRPVLSIQIFVRAVSGFNIPAGWALSWKTKRSESTGAAGSFQQPRSNAS